LSWPVRTEEEAKAELAEVLQWYEERRPGLGGQFLSALDRTITYIAKYPEAGRRIPGLKPSIPARRFSVAGFPYDLIYVRLASEIRVVAVAHDRREPGYWLSRLSEP